MYEGHKKNINYSNQINNNKIESHHGKPIIGVLIKENHIKRILHKQQLIYKHSQLMKANEKANVILCFFAVNDLDIKKQVVKGTYFNKETGKWQQLDFPYPNLIYKFYGTRKNNDSEDGFAKKLKKLNIKLINYYYCFNKWEAYQHLSKDKGLSAHLPLTILYENPDSLKKMFSYTDKIYLKGCESSLGRKVVCVTKLLEGGYIYSYALNKLFIKKAKDFNSLISQILKFYQNEDFILQEAIDLITIEDKIADLRSELHKNADGDIVVSGIAVRVGKPNTPIASCAFRYTLEDFFKDYMNFSELEIIELKNKIIKLLINIYQTIEKVYGESGELAIDLGMDKNRNLWFIECNAYSAKRAFYEVYDENTINQSYLNLLEYAKFIYTNTI